MLARPRPGNIQHALSLLRLSASRRSEARRPTHRCVRSPQAPKTSATFARRSEEHTSELQSLMRISYAVFCLKKKNTHKPLNILATLLSKYEDPHLHTLKLNYYTHTNKTTIAYLE